MPCMCLLPKTLVFIDFFWKHIMAQSALNGSCLCGSVKFEITPPLAAFRYCHCTRCQKASGSAHAANAFVPAAQFKWTAGEALIKRFPLPGAQRFAVWFCTQCGSRVPHEIPSRGELLVPAGLIDNAPADMTRPQNSIFWASRAAWYVPPGEMPCFNEYT
ncbi:MAG: GFA family protein [Betaproteobacteria bacterium]|jgi:hypothetical protein|nr:GFA family protein [Betaproteobacteria bacterium]